MVERCIRHLHQAQGMPNLPQMALTNIKNQIHRHCQQHPQEGECLPAKVSRSQLEMAMMDSLSVR